MSIISKRALALARKECYSSLYSPAFYGIAVFFLVFVSVWLFYLQRFFIMDTASLRPFFAGFPLVYILIIPVLTMKSWAEEKKLGSVEILLTMPFSEWELCLGKFISSFAVLLSLLVLTLPVPLSLIPLGNFDPGVIIGEYAGAVFLGCAAISLGLFLSALAKNQAGAFLGTAVVLMAVILLNQITLWAGLPSWLSLFINYISLSFHFESFSRGLLDSRDLAFFILTTGLFLFLNTEVLIYRKRA
ncbi:ABC transporter permease [Leadbettera azotonutricia]|uniref:ABC-type transport system involved in multi-copper enzyme maturation, permease component n=1 Tax=Leadbettera azotonutricia (strain ATCC BAA-888 / DSM 13862 / ZAS-9) TaxID=545695 RepID=F5YCW9_LEAAZ|nr:ABC transporter permease subunit [Leadbettera azotonutricia]AEF83180.1 ABC-type transport system involved in multi-copper enzyme maturation, permease component [Leadbettera azotonutricia ZAS-9]